VPPAHDAKDVRHAFHRAAVKWIDGSRANFDQDFIVLGNGLFNVGDLDTCAVEIVAGTWQCQPRPEYPSKANATSMRQGTMKAA